ncbi:MAG: PPK2 family polyphosphate kinase [Opitutales bacterium]
MEAPPVATSQSEPYRVQPQSRVDVRRWPVDDRESFDFPKKEGYQLVDDLGRRLGDLQMQLFAQKQHKVLIVLQGMDTSGKNGTIRHVFRYANPIGFSVASFNKPTPEELDRDYLWRVTQHSPAKGQIKLFDRSHYEDVTAVRVNKLAPETIWRARFDHINAWERMLADEGVLLLKFFLHIDKEEQRERLESRLKEPHKQWKFDPSDLVARERWEDYMDAYNEVFERTSFDHAPWFIIPSNRKWVRNIIIARIIVEQLDRLGLAWPELGFDPAKVKIP